MRHKGWKKMKAGIFKIVTGGACLVFALAVPSNPALAAEGTMSGYVYEEDGVTPVANEGVAANPADGTWLHWEAVTDGVGYYSIDVPFGEYNVAAATHVDTHYIREYYNEKINRRNADVVSVTSGNPNVTGINFTLKEAKASMQGTVFDHAGVGEGSVDIQYDSKKYTMHKYAATNGSGGYEFLYLAPGLAGLYVQPDVSTGYAQESRYAYLEEEELLTGFDFYLEEAALIDGIITMAHDGSRVNGAEIEARGGHFDGGWIQSEYSNIHGDGYYNMCLVPAEYEITVNRGSSAEDFIILPQYITVNGINDDKVVDMTLYRVPEDCVVVTGNITMNAEAQEGSMVVVMSLNAGILDSLKPGDVTTFSISDFGNEAVSCEYNLPLIPNQTYDLVFALANKTSESFDPSHTVIDVARNVVVKDSSFDGPNFSFNNAGGEITGRVTNADGNPVLMAQVGIFTADGEDVVGGAWTDRNGEYHIYNVPAGEYVAYGDHQDYWLEEAIKGATVTEGGVASRIDIVFGGRRLLLWNRLGSEYEVTHSEIGPDGMSFGSVQYLEGKFNKGIYSNNIGEYVTFPTSVFSDKTKGTIEFWLKTDFDVIDGVPQNVGDNPYVIDCYSGHSTQNGVQMIFNKAAGFQFQYWYNGTAKGVTDTISNWNAGDLIHVAAVWDKNGIDGTTETQRIYVNGIKTANAVDTLGIPGAWKNVFVTGCNWGSNQPMRSVMDNIKMYNYAKINFSDRFNEGQLLLWNKLGSEYEVMHSEVGPDGEIVGDIYYEPCHDENGFRSAVRTGDPNIPDNYVRFSNLQLGQKGCIELWYHPDWKYRGELGYDTHLLTYAKYNDSSVGYLQLEYNDWQDLLSCSARGNDMVGSAIEFRPSSQPGWNTSEPFHFAFSWDASAQGQKVWVYINGEPVSGNNYFADSTFLWSEPLDLVIGSRVWEGDWDRHRWEPNIDGVIDEIKVWDYAKREFEFENRAPMAEDIEATTDEDTSIDITLIASDPDGDSLIYDIIDGPSHGSASLDGDIVTYIPELNYNGGDLFTYIANDGEFDSNVATATIIINPVNDPPILDPINDQEVDESALLQFTINATDVDSPMLNYSASDLPDGAAFDAASRTFSWTPTYEQAGVYGNVHFEVDDSEFSDSENITITVHNVNQAPIAVISAEPTSGKSIKLKVNFSSEGSHDPDGDAITYLWDFKDGHTSTEPNPRHRFRKSGNFEVTLTVEDTYGATGIATVLIEVYNRRPRAFAWVWPRTFEGSKVRFWGFAWDRDGHIDEYEWNSSIDGVLSGQRNFSTTELSAGKHTITFRAKDNYGDWSRTVRRRVMVRRRR